MSIMFSLMFFMQIVTFFKFFWARQKFMFFASFILYVCVREWLFYFIKFYHNLSGYFDVRMNA